jgi:hypothetical protein
VILDHKVEQMGRPQLGLWDRGAGHRRSARSLQGCRPAPGGSRAQTTGWLHRTGQGRGAGCRWPAEPPPIPGPQALHPVLRGPALAEFFIIETIQPQTVSPKNCDSKELLLETVTISPAILDHSDRTIIF